MKINVQIERLVLKGSLVREREVASVTTSLASELARLLRAHGIAREFHSGGALAAMPAPNLRLGQRPSGRQLGRGIARSLYTGLSARR